MNHINPPPSQFVTVVAWIHIVLSGFGTVMSVLQISMFQTVFNRPEMQKAWQAAPVGTPPILQFLTTHMQVFFVAYCVVSVVTLAASIGLLKRKHWARLFFIGLMVLAIVWNLGVLGLQLTIFSSVSDSFATARGTPHVQTFFYAAATISTLFALGFCGLFGWIAKRLLAPAIVAEFKQ